MSETTTRVTVARTADADVRQRQVIVTIDDGQKATLMFGDSVTRDIAPGEHRLKANNTLVTKKVTFTAAPGVHVEFVVTNRAGKLTLGFLSLMGVAPLYLTLERRK